MQGTVLARGCGYRQEGQLYCEVRPARDGVPIEMFLMDPPRPWWQQSVGVKTIQDDTGTYHIIDVVGTEHYPYPSDFIEEGRRHPRGFSRRLPKNLNTSLLTPGSRLYCVHRLALLSTAPTGLQDPRTGGVDYSPNRHGERRWCPSHGLCGHFLGTGEHTHFTEGQPCSRHLWIADNSGQERTFLWFRYPTYRIRWDTAPQFQMAIFLKLPITNLTVIRSSDGSHQELLDKVSSRSSLPVLEEDI